MNGDLEAGKVVDVLLPRVSALTKGSSPEVTAEDFFPRITKQQPLPRLQAAIEEFGGGA